MTDGDDIRGVTRRRLLYAVGAAGTAGTVGGLGTAAFTSDRERLSGLSLSAGSLDLSIECEGDTCTVADDNTVTVTLADVLPGESGAEQFSLSLDGNPGWLWLGASCPGTGLAEALDVSVTYDRGCDGSVEESVSGTLREVLLELRQGIRLGDECLSPDEQACVDFEWRFPNESGVVEYEGDSLEFEFRFYTLQCRHNDGSRSPVEAPPCEGTPTATPTTSEHYGLSYIEVWGCTNDGTPCNCEKLGKIELGDAYVNACSTLQTDGISENHIESGIYDLPVDDDCEDTGYDIRITDTTEQDGETVAVAFDLLTDTGDPGPDVCKVVLKGGAGGGTVTYDIGDLGQQSNSTEQLLYTQTK